VRKERKGKPLELVVVQIKVQQEKTSPRIFPSNSITLIPIIIPSRFQVITETNKMMR
tara:strand:+ start:461 stop:631 length:171 start_codon:yes stop_codon:yes gene_type:complete